MGPNRMQFVFWRCAVGGHVALPRAMHYGMVVAKMRTFIVIKRQ